jgi:signal peptidase I
MIFYWLFSTTVRDAVAMRKHVYRMFCSQRDLMTPAAMQLVSNALLDLKKGLDDHVDKQMLKKYMGTLEVTANKWLRPYPHASIRENVEVLLVALAVAMAIRPFFLQPFKIPTGSMQPTLFGVTSEPDFSPSNLDFWGDRSKIEAEAKEQNKLRDDMVIPTGWARVKEWFKGNSYIHVVAQNDGTVEVGRPVKFLIFNIEQPIRIGGKPQTLWFPPDLGEQSLERRAGIDPNHFYHAGDEVIKMKVSAGDHLFVDRATYNFRKPTRGEIIVFQTAGIPEDMRLRYSIPADEFYIKRLVALPGEHVQIGNDRHLVINGQRIDAATPHFENVYGFNPDKPPHASQFSGHVNGSVAQEYGLYPNLAPLFPDDATVYNVPQDSYMVMGDNTCNSSDSRTWGSFPAKDVIGKSFFVYWPITERFGIGHWSTAQ